jgi:hypothetical protein
MERRIESPIQTKSSIQIAVENVAHTRRHNAWINARENVPAKRNNGRRSSVASSARLNARNTPTKVAKTWTLKE